ncbi:hypothetical protein CMV_018325 [Castanea mollissima]|uniref:Uncharacterized protein n=1 Tax=Castanea mollissima TaxID=60419 RepID=A0A8J4QRQ2_9ROSI|nr:hypothetical protein CMV_018325 [Castanea mollissima]
MSSPTHLSTLTSLSHCRRPQRHRPTADPLRRSTKPTQAPSRRSTPPPSPPSHCSPNGTSLGFWISWVSLSIQALGFFGFHRQSRHCLPQPIALVFRRTQESESLKDIPVVIMSLENIPSRINS